MRQTTQPFLTGESYNNRGFSFGCGSTNTSARGGRPNKRKLMNPIQRTLGLTAMALSLVLITGYYLRKH